MAQAARLNLRMQKELKLLLTDPPPGASFPSLSAASSSSSSSGASLSSLEARIEGPEGTVYAKGFFKLNIQIPDRYPFQPPIVTFATPIYHPNIDNGGRICLDILNLPPKGAWQPSLNISTVLTSIGLLLSEPNPDDGLMHEASQEYKYNRRAFDLKARSMTEKYARIGAGDIATGEQDCQSILKLSTDFAEAKGSDTSMQEVNQYLVGNKRLCGISRKLSLESSELDQERKVGKRANELPSEYLSGRQMEFTGLKQESHGMPSEQIPAHKDLQRMSKKLSTEPLISFHVKKDGHINDLVATKWKSTSTTDGSKPLLLPPASSNFQQTPSQFYERSTSDTDIPITKLEQKELLESLDLKKGTVNDQEELLSVARQSSTQCNSSGSHGNFPLPHIISQNRRETHNETVDGDGNGLLRTKYKKLGLAGRRFSSGMLVSHHCQGKDTTENLAPTVSFPLAHTSKNPTSSSSLLVVPGVGHCHDKSTLNYTTTRLEHIQPLKPLSQLSNSNDVNTQSGMESLKPSKISTAQHDSCYHEKLQAKQDYTEKFAMGIKKQERMPPSHDTDEVIVLDSEDSDEDQGRPARSKLSLARRRLPGKLKC